MRDFIKYLIFGVVGIGIGIGIGAGIWLSDTRIGDNDYTTTSQSTTTSRTTTTGYTTTTRYTTTTSHATTTTIHTTTSDDGHDDVNDIFPDNGFVKLPVGDFGVLTGIAENGVAKASFHLNRISVVEEHWTHIGKSWKTHPEISILEISSIWKWFESDRNN